MGTPGHQKQIKAVFPPLQVPEGIDFLKLSAYVMDKYRLEIAGGLGPSAGKVRLG